MNYNDDKVKQRLELFRLVSIHYQNYSFNEIFTVAYKTRTSDDAIGCDFVFDSQKWTRSDSVVIFPRHL